MYIYLYDWASTIISENKVSGTNNPDTNKTTTTSNSQKGLHEQFFGGILFYSLNIGSFLNRVEKHIQEQFSTHPFE